MDSQVSLQVHGSPSPTPPPQKKNILRQTYRVFHWLRVCYNNKWASLNLIWVLKTFRRLARKFELDQSERNSSQVIPGVHKALPNDVKSRLKFSTNCVYLRVRRLFGQVFIRFSAFKRARDSCNMAKNFLNPREFFFLTIVALQQDSEHLLVRLSQSQNVFNDFETKILPMK